MVEEARLESVYTPKGYHEFESRSLRIESSFLMLNKTVCFDLQSRRFLSNISDSH